MVHFCSAPPLVHSGTEHVGGVETAADVVAIAATSSISRVAADANVDEEAIVGKRLRKEDLRELRMTGVEYRVLSSEHGREGIAPSWSGVVDEGRAHVGC